MAPRTLTFAFVILVSLGTVSQAQDIPSNAHRMGNGWECNRGYSRAGNRCQPVIIPENAQLDYYGHGWECKRGFARVGSECQPVTIPANGQLDYYGHGWECKRGYVRVGSECQDVIIPANASLDYYGHGWDCNKAFKRVGNECEAVVVPANASLDYYGHSWNCDKGYKRVGNECRSVATSDLPSGLVSAGRPKSVESVQRQMPSESSTVISTGPSAPGEPSSSAPHNTAVLDSSALNVSRPKTPIQHLTTPNRRPESAPQPKRNADLPANLSPANLSPANLPPSRPTLPVTRPAKPDGSDNSFLILIGIFLAFGFLRLTGIVRP